MAISSELHQHILEWLEVAAENLRQSLKRNLVVDEKTNASDLVTEMDKATEAFFIEKIKAYYPEHRVIGEEGMGAGAADLSGMVWVIDPIDGTLNFVKQKNNFGILIGLYQDGKPVAGYIYDVMKHDVYWGIVGQGAYLNGEVLQPIDIPRLQDSIAVGNVAMFTMNRCNSQRLLENVLGVRAHGSAALETIEVIRGEASVYLSFMLSPWDFAAGWAICESLGFKVTKPNGDPISILEKSPIIMARPAIHAEVVRVLAEQKKELGDINEYA